MVNTKRKLQISNIILKYWNSTAAAKPEPSVGHCLIPHFSSILVPSDCLVRLIDNSRGQSVNQSIRSTNLENTRLLP